MSRKFSIDSAIILATLTAVLYTWSTAHYYGYIRALGLSTDLMERSFHQVMYQGLMISVFPIILLLIYCAAIIWFYAHVVLPNYTDWLRKSIKRKRLVIKVRRFILGRRNESLVEIKAKSIFAKFILVTLVAYSYIFSLAYYERMGDERAKELLASTTSDNSEYRVIRVSIDSELKNLLYISCGARMCAGLEVETDFIYYFDSSKGYSFKHDSGKLERSKN